MLETERFKTLLRDIGKKVSLDFSEDEVQMVFLNKGYFRELGYEVGKDLRSEFSLQDGSRIDYITTGKGNTVHDSNSVVYEFKQPKKNLGRYEEQLFDYMTATGSTFGVLTNGVRFCLYQTKPTKPIKTFDFQLHSATETEASTIILYLGYWSIQEQNIKPVAEATAEKAVEVIPEELHLDFSEAGIELFAKYLARYLSEELGSE